MNRIVANRVQAQGRVSTAVNATGRNLPWRPCATLVSAF